jgi:hypothetical protein
MEVEANPCENKGHKRVEERARGRKRYELWKCLFLPPKGPLQNNTSFFGGCKAQGHLIQGL